MTDDTTDWDRLDALYDEAKSADVTGDTRKAIEAYKIILAADPEDHLGVSLRLARLTGDKLQKAPNAYVAALFDQVADRFDAILVDELGYAVPLLIAEALQSLKLGPFPTWLDLGCGTGLCAMALEEQTTQRTGVDLAPTMIEIASELELYHELYVGELVAFLASGDVKPPYSLITAADVLPYIGDLDPLFRELKRTSEPGSILAFSTEVLLGEAWDFQVGAHKRFAHSRGCINRTLEKHGWEPLQRDAITVRMEQDEPVAGELVIARRV